MTNSKLQILSSKKLWWVQMNVVEKGTKENMLECWNQLEPHKWSLKYPQ